MNTFTPAAGDFQGAVDAAFEIFKITSRPWTAMIEGPWPRSGAPVREGAAWPAAEFWKMWAPWPNNILKSAALPAGERRTPLAVCLEQQQRCARLAAACVTCAAKMMGAMLAGFQNPHAAEKVFDNCRTAAEEYAQACQEFLDGQCAQLLSAWGRTAMPEAGDGKGKPANPRAQQEARA